MTGLKYQVLCDLALQGGHFHWGDTPIEVTPMAQHTDPSRQTFRNNDWWRGAEPRDPATGEALIRLTNGRTLRIRDGVEEENEHPNGKARGYSAKEIIKHQHEKQKTGVDELEPVEGESIGEWFGRIAKYRDFNSGHRKVLFDALRAYASRFHGGHSAKKLLDGKVVRKFLERIA